MSGQQTITGVNQQFASARLFERLDISGGDHIVEINEGTGLAIYCDTAGEIIKFDNTEMTGYTSLALQAGFNEIEVTKIYQTGSTVAGDIDIVAW